ncbi:SRP54-type protein [Zopfochytrium polystomum]|nr:SRP54-type protein [Zopfochytrium polystomum]
MLDLFSISTKGGIVLWSKAFTDISPSASSVHPVDALIADVLVEERGGVDFYDKDSFRVKWTFANDLGLIFVVVYQRILQLAYVDELLQLIKEAFASLFGTSIREGAVTINTESFTETFMEILSNLESRDTLEKKSRAPRTFKETKKFATSLEGSKAKPETETATSTAELSSSSVDDISAKLKKLQAKSGKKSPGDISKALPAEKGDKKPKKQLRTWDGGIPQDGGKKLDFSDSKLERREDRPRSVDRSAMGVRTADGLYDAAEMEARQDDGGDSSDPDQPAGEPLAFSDFLTSVTGGGGVLTEEQLTPLMQKMREHLIAKNVAAEIAESVTASVTTSLVGQKRGTFTSLNSMVNTAFESAVRRILTPRTSTDTEGRPYTFVFVGVNGVGKSTNLSKVCFWLLQNRLKVLIAACDTFRSGAVEQLRVHVRNLKALESGAVVDIFEKGYGKDSAGIAKEAIAFAKQNRYDVVLVDTAGRMQDNEPLMRALAKLVAVNNPDKIIFVGEALVGNEAVDQLTKFNQALRDFSGMSQPRQVDGIILSKFDTVDDKVGAALSMTFITRQPILFDLKRMNVRSICDTLLK